MSKSTFVASVVAATLFTSSLSLAEVITSPAVPVLAVAPVVVSDTVVTTDQVEPETDGSADRQETADSLDELVQLTESSEDLDAETRCLATAVYYEARSESLAGQLAVANVVVARSRSGRFPSSLCGVVTQPGQFSFVRAGRLPDAAVNSAQWRTARAIATIALEGSWQNPVRGALFFHAARLSPGWGKERVTRIGGHVFYR